MKFCEQLNQYMTELGCTAKALCAASGLSDAAISRYRSGEREPGKNSEQILQLAEGICNLAQRAGQTAYTRDAVLSALQDSLHTELSDFDNVTENLKRLLSIFGISFAELSRAMNFDASYLSRICSGQRRPVNPEAFLEEACRFIVRRCLGSGNRAALCSLIGVAPEPPRPAQDYLPALKQWLCAASQDSADSVSQFLAHLDEFDLGEYIRAIHFDSIRVPSAPFQLPTSRNYYGLSEMKQGELDFFKTTVLSKSAEPVFMCSDMPMADMAQDTDFAKKWMFALAVMLKKGLHLNIIHNIDRPFHEMMLGLESWIPLYMTGQVSPFYLKGIQNSVYCHFHYVSGAAALTGSCIEGFHSDAKYHLSKNREDILYYRRQSEHLLQKAQPLMEIYRQPSADLFQAFLRSDAQTDGSRHNLLSAPPLYTIPEALFDAILRRHGVSPRDAQTLRDFLLLQKERMAQILRKNPVLDEFPELTKEEFAAHPVALSLSGAFWETPLSYTYEEYCLHLQSTRDYAAVHPNYSLRRAQTAAFHNIQIQMHRGVFVIISKDKAPSIHFVIRHTKMLSAFENLKLPVVEE